jgi:hypothetical protein
MGHSAGLRGGVGSTFSRKQCIRPTLLMTRERFAIHGPHETRMIESHTWTERGKCVVCWSGFPLYGVH